MGYTHYFPAQRDFTPDEFARLGDAARKIIAQASQGVTPVQLAAEYDDPTEPPQIDGELIRFNGAGEEGYETFYLPRCREGAIFCKTAHRPYDVVVVAVLIAADTIAPGALTITSDGEPDEWQAGLTLASRAIPTLAAEVPAGVGA